MSHFPGPDCPCETCRKYQWCERPKVKRSVSKPRISEASIQDTCAEWLALDGWLRRIKTDLRHLRGMGVQEKGIPDDCFIRYTPRDEAREFAPGNWTRFFDQSRAQVIWIEWKSRDGVIGQKQAEWHQLERARGALVVVAKQDFPATVEGFQDWYRKSGLLQRSGL